MCNASLWMNYFLRSSAKNLSVCDKASWPDHHSPPSQPSPAQPAQPSPAQAQATGVVGKEGDVIRVLPVPTAGAGASIDNSSSPVNSKHLQTLLTLLNIYSFYSISLSFWSQPHGLSWVQQRIYLWIEATKAKQINTTNRTVSCCWAQC